MANATKIPFLDLVTPHQELEAELLDVVKKAFSNAGFIGGPMVEGFEREFAEFCGTKYCVGVNSGTDALRFAFLAAGVGPADIIVTVPNTFIATTEAISQAGAQIAFVDIDEQNYTMDPEKLREYLEEKCEVDGQRGVLVERNSRRRIAGIVPVHLYGQTADMDPILAIAEKYNLFVIEDACQAHGAEYFSKKDKTWKRAGSMGLAAAFSFYPGRIGCVEKASGVPPLPPFEDTHVPAPGEVPVCPRCVRQPLRPDVVLFGEHLPWPVMAEAESALHRADMLMVIGTSGAVS